MNERDRLVVRILRDALDTDPGEREAYVAARCGIDEALRSRVDALLREAGRLDAATPDPSAPPGGTDADALIGTRLGPFRVVERLGRGGMGVVYRGERENSDFTQTVAIKLIRRGFDFDDVNARFLRERRILARLSHPNLARLIDGGVAPDGRPWFALDFVHGQTITRWCDTQRLGVRARVRLFLDVCAAVRHAHAQLVVHRDLKPPNVLVDERGDVRLLDFGIASLLEGHEEDRSARTTLGSRYALTPEYAAPEQFGGGAVGVATDIYALGVLLYDLVAGVLPYVLDRGDLDAAERTVREVPPQPLAAAILRPAGADTGDDTAAARLAARSTTLRGYRADVRGDLTRIVQTALAKEPDRRYATVEAFAEDLARWLRGVPVRVSGNGLGYRFGKFVRRNRVAVTFAGVAVASLLAGVAGMAWKARAATLAAGRAEAMQAFVSGLFRSASPLATADRMPSVEDLLADGARRAQDETSADASTRFDMLMTIGRIYLDLRRYSEAIPLLKQTLALGETLYGPNDARLLPPLLALLQAETYQLEINNGAPQDAVSNLARAQALAAASGVDAATRADVVLADCALRQANARAMDGGVDVCAAAVQALEGLPHPDPAKLAKAYYLSARVLDLAAERGEDAIDVAQRGLDRIRALHGETARYDELVLSAQLSETLVGLNRPEEALVRIRQANALASQIFVQPHPDRAKLLFDEASLMRRLGREPEAEALLRQALDIYTAVYGERLTLKSADMFWTRLNLATSLTGQRRLDEADALIRGMIADVESDPAFRKQRRTVAQLNANLAANLVAQRRFDEAESLVAPILEPFKTDAQGVHLGAVPSRAYLVQARVLSGRGRPGDAIAWFEKAITALGDSPSQKTAIAQARVELGQTLREAGRVEEAIQVGSSARDTQRDVFGEAHKGTMQARYELALSLRRAGQPAPAADELHAAAAAAREILAADDPLRLKIEDALRE